MMQQHYINYNFHECPMTRYDRLNVLWRVQRNKALHPSNCA
jgi:hypothetical protein